MRRIFLTISLLFLVFSSSLYTLEDADSIFNFAQHLKEKGEFYRSVTEFERFRFLFPQDNRSETALENIIDCYSETKQYDKAARESEVFLDIYPQSSKRLSVLIKMVENYYALNRYSEGAGELEIFLAEHKDDPLKPEILQKIGEGYLKARKWEEAQTAFSQLATIKDSSLSMPAQTAVEELVKVSQLSHRSPMLSGTFSALLPGLGQLYCGRAGDAAASFSVNALFIYMTAYSFADKPNKEAQPVLGSLLALMELGWYSSNIYSAVNSAYQYNRKQEKNFIQKVSEQFTLHLSSQQEKGSYGVSWLFTF